MACSTCLLSRSGRSAMTSWYVLTMPKLPSYFAASLSLLDELILLDIYPAREEPIPGVTSQLIFDQVTIPNKRMVHREDLVDIVRQEKDSMEVILMLGAGNIDRLVKPVKQIWDEK